MRYAKIKTNDVANAPGVCVTVFLQGCPHRCYNCFNPETWDFNGGEEFTDDTLKKITTALQENGIHRDLCLMGGEPLCDANALLTQHIIEVVKKTLPDVKIYVWTGYIYEDLPNDIKLADYLIDGPYIDSKRDITLKMRGSRNQRIIDLRTGKDVTKEFDK